MRNYKIRIHWNKHKNLWSVHYRGKCYLVEHLDIDTTSRTEYNPNKRDNPKAWIVTEGILFHTPGSTYASIS